MPDQDVIGHLLKVERVARDRVAEARKEADRIVKKAESQASSQLAKAEQQAREEADKLIKEASEESKRLSAGSESTEQTDRGGIDAFHHKARQNMDRAVDALVDWVLANNDRSD